MIISVACILNAATSNFDSDLFCLLATIKNLAPSRIFIAFLDEPYSDTATIGNCATLIKQVHVVYEALHAEARMLSVNTLRRKVRIGEL